LDFSGNKAGGVPPVMFNIAPRITLDKFLCYCKLYHLDKRPANSQAHCAFTLQQTATAFNALRYWVKTDVKSKAGIME
jgi:hypothetical protein